MGQRTQNWKTKRYVADIKSMVVHDRRTGGCPDDTLRPIALRGDAIGFEPDELLSALELLFNCCPYCISWDDVNRAIQELDEPPAPTPLLPRGPLVQAGNAESMEDLADEDDVQAA
jgi:hypothetical protein